jgi:hypothetical protein
MLFGAPGILVGDPPSETFLPQSMWVHNPDSGKDPRRFGGIGYKLGSFNPLLFGRMLAKIAHSFAVADQGAHSFRPFLSDLILGKNNSLLSYLVGGELDPSPAVEALHRLHLHCLRPLPRSFIHANKEPLRLLLIVDIRLFAHMGAPQYRVVVGEWKGSVDGAPRDNTSAPNRRPVLK